MHPSAPGSVGARPGAEEGYVVALMAVLLLPLLAFTGFAVDLGAWYARAAHLQRAADAAALAGVTFLPNRTEARRHALDLAARNGFADDATVDIEVEAVATNRLRVTITDRAVDQFFTGIFADGVRITRSATAEHLRPIPMGSPRNHLGTNALLGGGAREDFWLSVGGYCARREAGERLTAASDANGRPAFAGCIPGGGVLANPEHRAEGYFYAVELDDGDDLPGEAWPYAPVIEVYDAAQCQGAGTGAADGGALPSATAPGGVTGGRAYTFRVRDNDHRDPGQATVLAEETLRPEVHCGDGPASWAARWRPLATLAGATEGTYAVQVVPEAPDLRQGYDSQEGDNQFALRVRNPSWGTSGWACTADPAAAVAAAPHRPHCPQVYGLHHLGVFANARGADPSFTLAEIGPAYAGRMAQVELFDPGEGARSIQILDPAGDPVPLTWEVGCTDGSYPSHDGACRTGERPPVAPGWGPYDDMAFDVCRTADCTVGDSHRPWGGRNAQAGTYSGRLVRLSFRLPTLAEEPTWFGGHHWFRIRYVVATDAGVRDRTTWSIAIPGDPVRLVD